MAGLLKSSSLLEAVALVGLGIIIENPEKRKKLIGTLDRAGGIVEKTVKDFTKGGAVNVPISAESDNREG